VHRVAFFALLHTTSLSSSTIRSFASVDLSVLLAYSRLLERAARILFVGAAILSILV
jgi:hypothetical protein